MLKNSLIFFKRDFRPVRMVRIDGGGAFITFLAINGSGYVRIIKSQLKEAASLMSETEQKFDMLNTLSLAFAP